MSYWQARYMLFVFPYKQLLLLSDEQNYFLSLYTLRFLVIIREWTIFHSKVNFVNKKRVLIFYYLPLLPYCNLSRKVQTIDILLKKAQHGTHQCTNWEAIVYNRDIGSRLLNIFSDQLASVDRLQRNPFLCFLGNFCSLF